MPKSKKKRGRGNRSDKEKPLLSVQGILRLEKSFITPKYDDADSIVFSRSESSQPQKILLIPGSSEHDLVHYKAGYQIGPSNPFPTNETEKRLYDKQIKMNAINDAFEVLKRESESEKKLREAEFKSKLLSETGVEPNEMYINVNMDDPQSYHLPSETQISFIKEEELCPPGEEEKEKEENEKNKDLEEKETEETDLESEFVTENVRAMVLDVVQEIEENQKKENEESRLAERTRRFKDKETDNEKKKEEEKEDDKFISLEEMMTFHKVQEQQYGPIQVPVFSQDEEDAKSILKSYWTFVLENPQDFNGWTYLLHHVEIGNRVEEIREAYNKFLPLFPYCYAYWIRYADIEKKQDYWNRSLAILHRALDAIPISVDLWIVYLELYSKLYESHENFEVLFREQLERGITSAGLEYRSDPLWDFYINWESNKKNITNIYRRLIATPTQLYNKHWDNFLAHVRENHPRNLLDYENYEELRQISCQELQLTYRRDPVLNLFEVRSVAQPEDKLKAGMKERLVASFLKDHEATERKVENISGFEDKIKQHYFHVRPLDAKQLKNWDAYLNYEIQCGTHERILFLFERCLIPCAHYEQFWAKYARYLEKYFKGTLKVKSSKSSYQLTFLDIETARRSLETQPQDYKGEKASWTLRGWKTKNDEEKKADSFESQTEKVDKKSKDRERNDNESMDQELNEEERNLNHDAVRGVYKRASYIHCQSKASIKLKWAAFEEEIGNFDIAKNLLRSLSLQYPLLLECSMQLIDLHRRLLDFDECESLYKKLLKRIPTNRQSVKNWVSMKFARYYFKVRGQPEKALSLLRSTLKKDRSDPRLYSQIIDVCYQRYPVDINGVTAAIELALSSPQLNSRHKFEFIKRKVEFLTEFGDVSRLVSAYDELRSARFSVAAELKAESLRKLEYEIEEKKLKDLEDIKAQTRAAAAIKGKIAEEEGRLLCQMCQTAMYPDRQGIYEFESFQHTKGHNTMKGGVSNNDNDKDNNDDDDVVLDLLNIEISEEQEAEIQKSLKEKTKYKEVAPTWELNIETYGYGGKRKRIYDPDYEHVESAKFKEYERLETEGYDDEIKDTDNTKLRVIPAPGLGLHKEPRSDRLQFTSSDYVIPPKIPLGLTTLVDPEIEAQNPLIPPGLEHQVFELPPEISNPQKSPCVNVPEWFVKEGGELCLSDTENGISLIRYWPKFLSEKGNRLMFSRLRQYCKWHQKQVQIGGDWKYETRLVAWYGPCDHVYSGLNLETNLNWAPEHLDLLHRLSALTRHDYNSCFVNLYRQGHDVCGWHSDTHPQLGKNPSIASVSLGVVRVFEFRSKNGPSNFIRFPLFPGSLLLMEGATQNDWLH